MKLSYTNPTPFVPRGPISYDDLHKIDGVYVIKFFNDDDYAIVVNHRLFYCRNPDDYTSLATLHNSNWPSAKFTYLHPVDYSKLPRYVPNVNRTNRDDRFMTVLTGETYSEEGIPV
jgi:hypothetical protein